MLASTQDHYILSEKWSTT